MAVFTGDDIRCLRAERLVLDQAGFRLADGGALILKGANGSGKSTLLRLMAGLMRPQSGHLHWDGVDIADDAQIHNRRMSYIGHADAIKPLLSVYENVAFWAALYGNAGQTPEQAMQTFAIDHLGGLPARYLSAGQRRRVGLCRILTQGAPLWLLDEPTTALDPATIDVLVGVIEQHRRDGGMAVLSIHGDIALKNTETLSLDGNRGAYT
ncbi:MAG: heme ABC exporter ATP-binding protein CcmA [Rhodospirillales bacterium]